MNIIGFIHVAIIIMPLRTQIEHLNYELRRFFHTLSFEVYPVNSSNCILGKQLRQQKLLAFLSTLVRLLKNSGRRDNGVLQYLPPFS
jgi:hypothetical protein